ncbi:ABC transporter permease [Kurthia sp. Dielmo]|uniref:ABC transporter permease n=1 Tax=Kurthia sp. Dielmo TaxID=1033738 RepID=UPI00111DFE44|nr:ABC transporter permease [Kurthia sp. Dielmo]
MFSLSIKEMTFFKLKYLLIGFILFFVAALVFIISGLANGLANDNASSMKELEVTNFYLAEDSENRLDRSQFTIEQAGKAKDASAFGVQMQTTEKGKDGKKIDSTFMTFENKKLLPTIIEGKMPQNANEVIVDKTMQEHGVKLGSVLYLPSVEKKVKVSAFTEHFTYSHTPVIVIQPALWEKVGFTYNALVSTSGTPAQSIDGDWSTKEDVVAQIPGYSAEQSSLNMMLSFLIIIAVFVLGAFFYIMTIQKVQQFGILKAIGAKSKSLIRATMLQVFILSITSITLAALFAYILPLFMPEGMPFVFEPTVILSYGAALFAVSLIGALISTISIVKADPIQAMGRVE